MAENKGRADYEADDMWDEDEEDSQKDKFLTFHIADEEFAIPIGHVIEIVGIQKITEVPDMPNFVKGVINLRGKVIPVMDVRLRFKLQEAEYNDRTCVVVVSVGEVTIGLVVDTVSEVVTIPETDIAPPPRFSSAASGRYVSGMGKIGDAVKIIIDTTKLLRDEELAAFQA
ncbi:MAG TPA: chemotaxis protein CheW [Verrucomicrobia bacterium]|nr:chemotaxis protein CheW [Verrucomicrobiota bacterium]